MKIKSYRIGMCIIAASLFFTTACGNQQGNRLNQENQNGRNTEQVRDLNRSPGSRILDTGDARITDRQNAVIQMRTYKGKSHVPLDEIVTLLEFNSVWDEETRTHNIGDNDIVYKIKVDSTEARNEDEVVKLSNAPVLIDGKTYIPAEDVTKIFEGAMNAEIQNQKFVLHPTNPPVDRNEIFETNEEVTDDDFFADDPEDPAGDAEVWSPLSQDESIPTIKDINISKMLGTARNYLGVDYKFGAKHYSKSKRFDCSSYTKYVYGKYGVTLKRISKNQAKQGTAVSRKNLRKGDLMFFYVPGRFKTNKTIGHVGIYIGNNKMIHSSPQPKNGVQITSINKAFWKKTYIKSRRVVK
jgi:cell wall-associated NlpC family hydrolase